MKLRRRHAQAKTALDFTSLVDIALVLVVFFLLSAQSMQAQAIPVALPQAGTGQTPPTQSVEVVIDRAGTILVRGVAVELKQLAAAVGSAKRVAILADTDARHGRVVEVVDHLRKAGVAEVYYATRKPVEDW